MRAELECAGYQDDQADFDQDGRAPVGVLHLSCGHPDAQRKSRQSEQGPYQEVADATSAVSRPRRVSPVLPTAWRWRHSIGTKDGSIIATIIRSHMPRKGAAVPGHVCPHIGSHAVDIVQPPGIGISSMADMDARQTIIPAALALRATPRRRRRLVAKHRGKSLVVISCPLAASTKT